MRTTSTSRSLLFIAAGALLAWFPEARADVIHLKNGRKMEGTIVGRDDKWVQVKTVHGTIRIPARDVVDVEGKPLPAPRPEKPAPASQPTSPAATPAPQVDAGKHREVADLLAKLLAAEAPPADEDRRLWAEEERRALEVKLRALGAEGALYLVDLCASDAKLRPAATRLLPLAVEMADERCGPRALALATSKEAGLAERRAALAFLGEIGALDQASELVSRLGDPAIGETAGRAIERALEVDAAGARKLYEERGIFPKADARTKTWRAIVQALDGKDPTSVSRARLCFTIVVATAWSDDAVLDLAHALPTKPPERVPVDHAFFIYGLVRRAANGKLEERVIDEVFTWSDDGPVTRASVAKLCGRLKARDRVPWLLQELDDDAAPCREAAVGALREISGLPYRTKSEWLLWWEKAKPRTREG